MEEFNVYPNKPQLESKKVKDNTATTFFSMVLFVVVLYFLFSDSLGFILLLVAVLLFHEMGHYLFMKRFRYKNVRMLFVPLMGAFVQGFKEKYSQAQSLLVVLAGPIPGIIIGIVVFYLASSSQSNWLMNSAVLLIFLNVINLLPVDPLDGGQLLKLLLPQHQDVFPFIFSLISSLTIICIGVYFSEYILMLFGFLMAFRVRNQQRNYEIRKDLKAQNIDYVSTYKALSDQNYARIKEIVLHKTPTLRKYVEMNDSDEDIEPMIASQVRNILVAPLERDVNLLNRTVVVLIWLFSVIFPAYLVFQLISNPLFSWYVIQGG